MELITRWNEFCDANGYPEVIYPNDGLEALIKRVYGTEISPQKAVEIVHNYVGSSYTEGCRWWWLNSDGTFGGASTVGCLLPIDRRALNAWCQEQGYDTPWEDEDE